MRCVRNLQLDYRLTPSTPLIFHFLAIVLIGSNTLVSNSADMPPRISNYREEIATTPLCDIVSLSEMKYFRNGQSTETKVAFYNAYSLPLHMRDGCFQMNIETEKRVWAWITTNDSFSEELESEDIALFSLILPACQYFTARQAILPS